MSLKFSLENLEAISIGSCWDKEPDISRVPPVARRRLKECARLAFGVSSAVKLDVPVVFSSYAGEINRCLDLLANLKNEVSPTSFSLSVLNAVPAQLSIDSRNHSPILAVSARASFEMAIANALKYERAYVISYFEMAKKPYFDNEPLCVAIGAFVTHGKQFSLECEPNLKTQDESVSEICFLQNFNSKAWEFFDGALKWNWRRHF